MFQAMNRSVGLIIVLTAISLASMTGQSPSPTAAPEASPAVAKHKHSKKQAPPEANAAAATSRAATAEASPTVGKHKRSRKEPSPAATAAAATAPAAVSPTPARRSWFHSSTASPAPAASPAMATPPVATTTTSAKTAKAVEPAGAAALGGGPGMVWVNTESHTYHKEGSRWYGRTKKGKYMSEQDALKEGAHLDKEEARVKKQP